MSYGHISFLVQLSINLRTGLRQKWKLKDNRTECSISFLRACYFFVRKNKSDIKQKQKVGNLWIFSVLFDSRHKETNDIYIIL